MRRRIWKVRESRRLIGGEGGMTISLFISISLSLSFVLLWWEKNEKIYKMTII